MTLIDTSYFRNENRSLSGAVANGADLVSAAALWCEALHMVQPLDKALTALARALGADAAALVRSHAATGSEAKMAQYQHPQAEMPSTRLPVFARNLFGPELTAARQGTFWLGSVAREQGWACDLLSAWQQASKTSEFGVFVLSARPSYRDHIELHFAEPLSATDMSRIGALLPTIARTWENYQAEVSGRDSAAVSFRRGPMPGAVVAPASDTAPHTGF